jgi:hypothetical protein
VFVPESRLRGSGGLGGKSLSPSTWIRRAGRAVAGADLATVESECKQHFKPFVQELRDIVAGREPV